MKLRDSTPAHERFYQSMCQAMQLQADELSGLEMLAIAANFVGKLIAMQDQSVVTREMAIELVGKNIEYGNQMVLRELNKTQRNA